MTFECFGAEAQAKILSFNHFSLSNEFQYFVLTGDVRRMYSQDIHKLIIIWYDLNAKLQPLVILNCRISILSQQQNI